MKPMLARHRTISRGCTDFLPDGAAGNSRNPMMQNSPMLKPRNNHGSSANTVSAKMWNSVINTASVATTCFQAPVSVRAVETLSSSTWLAPAVPTSLTT